MVDVKVTLTMGRRTVSADEVRDARIAGPLRQAGKDVAAKLAKAKCPEHGKAPWNVRLHFDAGGNGDLKYESCCEKLGEVVKKTLG